MKTFNPTNEQVIINELVVAGNNVLVEAGAGVGKSSTLRYVAQQNPTTNFLVLCFNSTNAKESLAHPERTSNIFYSTVHSIAYRAIVSPSRTYVEKLKAGYYSYKEVDTSLYDKFGFMDTAKDAKEKEDMIYLLRRSTLDCIIEYCRSDSTNIYEYALNKYKYWFRTSVREASSEEDDIVVEEESIALTEVQMESLTTLTREHWLCLIDEDCTFSITHDTYLKLYHLRNFTISEVYDVTTKKYVSIDTLCLDECLTDKHYVRTIEGDWKIKRLVQEYTKGKAVPLIKTFNIDTQEYEYKSMTGALTSHNRETLLIRTEGLNKLHCTPNHPILTQRGYVNAEELVVGQDILYLDTPDNQKTKLLLNEDQYQLVLGSYLGDGHIDKRSNFNTYRLKLVQGEKQKDYLLWKASCLNISKLTLGQSGYTGIFNIYNSEYTKTFLLEKPIEDCLWDMSEKALAVWYMDDGSLSKSNTISIHSNSFSYDEHTVLQHILEVNFSLYSTIKITKGYYYLTFDAQNSKRLLSLIHPYIHKDLAYKTIYSLFPEHYIWDNMYQNIGANYISSITYEGINTVYDITVEDNHNFITSCRYNGTGIIVHNCQDSNPVTVAIFKHSTMVQQVVVGDGMQQLYAWRGATNAMEQFPNFVKAQLSTSFRFNNVIANYANTVLYAANSELKLTGSGTHEIVKTTAFLCRTNSALLSRVIEASNNKQKVFTSTALKELFSKLYHLSACYFDQKPKYPNRTLKDITNKAELEQAVANCPEIKQLLRLSEVISKAGGTLHKGIEQIKASLVTSEANADVIVSTIHKSKGLEWDNVVVDASLIHFNRDKEGNIINPGETIEQWLKVKANLCMLYVAVTRAKVNVEVPVYLQEMFYL